MKYSTIIGLVLVVVGLALYILQGPIYFDDKNAYITGLLALGAGLFLGGIMGFLQKKRKKVKVVNTVLKTAEPVKNPIEKDNNNQDLTLK